MQNITLPFRTSSRSALLPLTLLGLCLAGGVGVSGASDAKPKYGPDAIPLSVSHDFFQGGDTVASRDEANKSIFWKLIPYYTAQQDDSACSLASVTMILNGARVGSRLRSDEELITQKALFKKVDDPIWNRGLGPMGHGVALDDLGILIKKSFATYGRAAVSAQVFHVNQVDEKSQSELRRALEDVATSGGNFLVLNFLQGVYTGDAPAGHIAPVGAYDKKNRRVLVLDPDRQWYEPYWVSEEVLLKGMATQDKVSSKSRGYVWVRQP